MQQSKEYIRLAADLQSDSIVDGPGLRAVIWTQGCSHNCKGCQNPGTHDFNGGGLVPIKMVCDAIDELEYHTGITFSGGDPMFQPVACNEIAKYAKSKGYNIWVYTGFTYDKDLIPGGKRYCEVTDEILDSIDILVDGKFILEQKNISLKFRGSENQRIIDMKQTRKEGHVVLSPLNN